jgi:type IV secretory pathway TrbD component
MVRQLFISGVVSVANIAIHALAMVAVVRIARTVSERDMLHGAARLVAIMIGTVSALMVTHISEVIVWSVAYATTGAAPTGTDPLYFAFVNYTTLGYGDVIPVERWRLIGPMTAMNGVLLFGWSTAVIFEILRRTVVQDSSRHAKWPI